MPEKENAQSVAKDDGDYIELRGTDPRVFLPSISPAGKPGGRQPILPKDREAAQEAADNHS